MDGFFFFFFGRKNGAPPPSSLWSVKTELPPPPLYGVSLPAVGGGREVGDIFTGRDGWRAAGAARCGGRSQPGGALGHRSAGGGWEARWGWGGTTWESGKRTEKFCFQRVLESRRCGLEPLQGFGGGGEKVAKVIGYTWKYFYWRGKKLQPFGSTCRRKNQDVRIYIWQKLKFKRGFYLNVIDKDNICEQNLWHSSAKSVWKVVTFWAKLSELWDQLKESCFYQKLCQMFVTFSRFPHKWPNMSVYPMLFLKYKYI